MILADYNAILHFVWSLGMHTHCQLNRLFHSALLGNNTITTSLSHQPHLLPSFPDQHTSVRERKYFSMWKTIQTKNNSKLTSAHCEWVTLGNVKTQSAIAAHPHCRNESTPTWPYISKLVWSAASGTPSPPVGAPHETCGTSYVVAPSLKTCSSSLWTRSTTLRHQTP